MSKKNQQLGKFGEESAIDFLKNNGYKILATNYRTRLGEIDIVAKDEGTICFIEVKTRLSDRFGLPQEALTRFKQRQIAKTALHFLKDNSLLEKKARFDVVSVMARDQAPSIDLIKNAFEMDGSFIY